MKKYLIIIALLLVSPCIVWAALNCQPADCAALGYSTSNVTNCEEYIYCPFNSSYKACIKKKELYPLSECPEGGICRSLPKYAFDGCNDLYTLNAAGTGCDENDHIGFTWTVTKSNTDITLPFEFAGGTQVNIDWGDGTKSTIDTSGVTAVIDTDKAYQGYSIKGAVKLVATDPIDQAFCLGVNDRSIVTEAIYQQAKNLGRISCAYENSYGGTELCGDSAIRYCTLPNYKSSVCSSSLSSGSCSGNNMEYGYATNNARYFNYASHAYSTVGTYNVTISGNPTYVAYKDVTPTNVTYNELTSLNIKSVKILNLGKIISYTKQETLPELPHELVFANGLFHYESSTNALTIANGINNYKDKKSDIVCHNLTTLPELPDSLKYAAGMFCNCYNLVGPVTKLPSSLEAMQYMFYYDQKLNQLSPYPEKPVGIGSFEQCKSAFYYTGASSYYQTKVCSSSNSYCGWGSGFESCVY